MPDVMLAQAGFEFVQPLGRGGALILPASNWLPSYQMPPRMGHARLSFVCAHVSTLRVTTVSV